MCALFSILLASPTIRLQMPLTCCRATSRPSHRMRLCLLHNESALFSFHSTIKRCIFFCRGAGRCIFYAHTGSGGARASMEGGDFFYHHTGWKNPSAQWLINQKFLSRRRPRGFFVLGAWVALMNYCCRRAATLSGRSLKRWTEMLIWFA